MVKVIGQITIAVVLVTAGAAGVLTPIAMSIVEAMQPTSQILMRGWTGFTEGGEAAEKLVCDRQGDRAVNCRTEGQRRD